MRIAAMLVVAAVGCSTPVGGPPDDALPITTVGKEPAVPARAPSSSSQPTPLTGALQRDPISPELPNQLSWAGADVTSTFSTPNGDVYSTGTFVGSIVIGGHQLRSKGSTDIFLVKWQPNGSLEWVLSIGSPEKDSDAKITAVDEDRVHVIGLTAGRMDCGTGPLTIFSTETFFVCSFATADGFPQTAGTFPTGVP